MAGLADMGKIPELKSRILFTLGMLVVFRIGAHIPVPGIDAVVLAELFKQVSGTMLGMFDMFSGGALSRLTIFALGIMPYISAAIIIQLMTVVSPKLEQLKKEGEAGRRKITEYTRYGMRDILQARSVDVLMPDLQRIGGFSEMRRVRKLSRPVSGVSTTCSP